MTALEQTTAFLAPTTHPALPPPVRPRPLLPPCPPPGAAVPADPRLVEQHLGALAVHLADRRGAILQAWRDAVRRDPALVSGHALSRDEMNDHIPALLAAFERELAAASATRLDADAARAGTAKDAEAHGSHRWQQGYDLREVTLELSRLNECMCIELEMYAEDHPGLPLRVMAAARRRWAQACTVAIGESTDRFYCLQQLEAAGHIEELEAALEDLTELDRLRAELWQQAAHDLRGNVAVVANATVALSADEITQAARQRFMVLLQRNVGSLNHLLNDVTSLARLQAGEEHCDVALYDVAELLGGLCQGLTGLAEQRGLTLRFGGPSPMPVEGDAVKVRRIVQNLILNALSCTREGGIVATWGDAAPGDERRWLFTLRDTGPGLRHAPIGVPAGVLERATALVHDEPCHPSTGGSPHGMGGEGLGLSIVKRLCDLLDAAVEVDSREGEGTTFRILMPRQYDR
jgi:two-component sensor histidine kinase